MNCWQCGAPVPPNSGFCGACGKPQAAAPQPGYAPPGYPPQPAQFAPAPLRPFPLILQRGLTRLTGQMFVAPARLFFICESQKGGLAVALGRGVGGLIGGLIAAAVAPVPGQAAPVIDEPVLFQAVQERPGSLVMEPNKIKAIKYTMWTRGIFFDGKTYALRDGMSKELQHELAGWTRANNVKNAGLK